MPYTDYPNPNAKLNHRIDNVELSHAAAIAEDVLRDRAQTFAEDGFEWQNMHDDLQDAAGSSFAIAQEMRHRADSIGHMILAREIPEKY